MKLMVSLQIQETKTQVYESPYKHFVYADIFFTSEKSPYGKIS